MGRVSVLSGVTGQSGSYMAELLIENGYEVYGIVRRSSTDNTVNLKSIIKNPKLHLVYGDVTDSGCIMQLIKETQPDECYNFACQSHVRISFDTPAYTFQTVACGALNFLEAIRVTSPHTKFSQSSSSEMFGQQYSIRGGEYYQGLDTPMIPCSPYAIGKLAAHNMTKLYRESYNIFAVSSIKFNHEGTRRGEEFVTRKVTKYVGELSHYLNGGEQHPVKLKLGNLDASRDWSHAKDMVYGDWLMLQQDKPDDYILASGETHTIRELLDIAFGTIGINDWSPFVEIDKSLFRPSEVPYLRGDASKAREKLGWNTKISFQDMIKEMVAYDVANAA